MKHGDGRNAQLVRMLRLVREVRQTPVVNLRGLAAQFKVHPRTIRRDIQALTEAGWLRPRAGGDKSLDTDSPRCG